MNLLTVFSIFLVKILCEEDGIEIKKVHFLENNFLDCFMKRTKTEKGYLSEMLFVFEEHDSLDQGFNCFFDEYFYLNYSRNEYILLHEWLAKVLIESSNQSEDNKNLIRIHFLFTDDLIKNFTDFQNYQGRKQYYETYRWAEKLSDNGDIINLKFDEDKARMINIKEKLRRLVSKNFLKLQKYIYESGEYNLLKALRNGKDFDLYHFESYFKCLECLKKFVKNIPRLKFKGRNVPNKNIDANTTISESKFRKCVFRKIEEDLEKLSGFSGISRTNLFFIKLKNFFRKNKNDLSQEAALKTIELLIKKCFYRLKNDILKRNLSFLIGSKYDIDFYINELYSRVYELAIANHENFFNSEYEEKVSILRDILNKLYDDIKDLQKTIIEDLFETEDIQKHFSLLFEEDSETLCDYITIEKIVCDFYNMLVYIKAKRRDSYKKSLMSPYYYPPILTENYNCRIISGIQIRFLAENLKDLKSVEAFDRKGRKVDFVKDVHYFINFFNEMYFTSEILKKLNIEEIQVNSNKSNIYKRFKISN